MWRLNGELIFGYLESFGKGIKLNCKLINWDLFIFVFYSYKALNLACFLNTFHWWNYGKKLVTVRNRVNKMQA